ncbi:MAG: LamG-like jellyroll fold domain-containing protein [Deferribacterales bacterium]
MSYKTVKEILNDVFDSSDAVLRGIHKTEGEVLNMVLDESGDPALKVRIEGLEDDFYTKTQTDTQLSAKMTKSAMSGIIGNLSAPLLHLPLKKNLLTSQGQSICTFTRASTATYTDRYGVLKTAAADTPRFTADGLLIEGASTNLLTYSEQFDNAVWVKSGSAVTANTTVVTDPYGTNLADKLTEDTSTVSHYVESVSISFTAGTIYALSVFAKKAERDQFRLYFPSSITSGRYGHFDLSAGTVVSTGTGITAKIKPIADGWYRCSISVTAGATTTGKPSLVLAQSNSVVSYAGDGASGLYIFGAQLEAMPFATSYIPATTAAATRAADNCSFPLADNMVKLQQSTGHAYVMDIKLLWEPSAATDRIALGGDTIYTRHGIGFYGGGFFSQGAKGGASYSALSGINTLLRHRYSAVYTGAETVFYIDGLRKDSKNDANPYEYTSVIYIGSAFGTRFLNGTISNLCIYDRALTEEEVNAA